MNSQHPDNLGAVQTYPFMFENGDFFLQFALTRVHTYLMKMSPKTPFFIFFKNALHSGERLSFT